jgi:hypothetical protein
MAVIRKSTSKTILVHFLICLLICEDVHLPCFGSSPPHRGFLLQQPLLPNIPAQNTPVAQVKEI